MDNRLRFPYTKVKLLPGSTASAVLISEMTGVIPLPAGKCQIASSGSPASALYKTSRSVGKVSSS